MSDYELIDLLYQNISVLQTVIMNFVAVLFAFLIAGYLVADKLGSRIVLIIVALFTIVALQQALATIGVAHDFVGLIGLLADRASQDSSNLGWHSSTLSIKGVGQPVLHYGPTIVIIFSYIGGLIFFFHQRHLGSKHPENGNSKDG